jgi:hypothetical protein
VEILALLATPFALLFEAGAPMRRFAMRVSHRTASSFRLSRMATATELYRRMLGEWRSLVAHLLWEQRVAGSNPVSPTIFQWVKKNKT